MNGNDNDDDYYDSFYYFFLVVVICFLVFALRVKVRKTLKNVCYSNGRILNVYHSRIGQVVRRRAIGHMRRARKLHGKIYVARKLFTKLKNKTIFTECTFMTYRMLWL